MIHFYAITKKISQLIKTSTKLCWGRIKCMFDYRKLTYFFTFGNASGLHDSLKNGVSINRLLSTVLLSFFFSASTCTLSLSFQLHYGNILIVSDELKRIDKNIMFCFFLPSPPELVNGLRSLSLVY